MKALVRNCILILTILIVAFIGLLWPVTARAQELMPTETPTLTVTVTPEITSEVTPSVDPSQPIPTTTEPPRPANNVDILAAILGIVYQFAALAGVAALVAAVVNVLKLTPLINNGDTGPWYACLSLVAFGALVYFNVFTGIDVTVLDQKASQIATVLIFIAAYVSQLGIGQGWHNVLKQLELWGISTSFSKPPAPAQLTNKAD